jgi:hypothetical protein
VLYRWADALGEDERKVVPAERLEQLLRLPYGSGEDHAEGVCWLPGETGGTGELLVVYDSPADDRLHDETAVHADVFRLGQRAPAKPHRRRAAR